MEMEEFFDLRNSSRRAALLPDLPGIVKQTKNAGLQLNVGKQSCIDTLDVPATPIEDVGQLGVDLRTSESPVDKFVENEVTFTTKKGLVEMVEALPKLQDRSLHGCIVQEGLRPDGSRYQKGIHYLEQEVIGRGSYGSVTRCIDTISQKTFVMKRMKKTTLQPGEITVPLNLSHKNLAKVYGLIHQPDSSLELLLEDAGVSLNRYLESNTLSEDQIWNLLRQGLQGLEHLHLYGMIHLDIKPENTCLQNVGGSLRLMIVDFGSSKLSHERLMFLGWTPEYLSSERCRLFLQASGRKAYGIDESAVTSKTDVFAWALVIMYMYKKYHILQKLITNGHTSYRHLDPNTRQTLQLRLMVTLAEYPDFVTNLIPDECDLDMRELLTGMTRHDPVERLDTVAAIRAVEARDKRIIESQLKIQKARDQCTKQTAIPWNTHTFYTNGEIPEMANNVQDFETGPIKNATKDKLRMKLHKPYTKGSQTSGKGSPKGHHLASKKFECLGSPMEVNAELKDLSEKFSSQPNMVELGILPAEKRPVAETLTHQESVMETCLSTDVAMDPVPRVPVVVSQPADRTDGQVVHLRRQSAVKTAVPTGPAQLTQEQLIQLLLANKVSIQQQAAQFISVRQPQHDFIDLSAREGPRMEGPRVQENQGNIPDFNMI